MSLIGAGAFAIHQIRYLLANGGLGSEDLIQRSDIYLSHSIPLLVGLMVAGLTAHVVRGSRSDGSGSIASRRARAASYAVGIVAVFFCQDLLEGLLLAGHASGLAAIFSTGGWAAIPLAALFGLIAALVDRGLEAIEELAGETSVPESPEPMLAAPQIPQLSLVPLAPLAFGLARRPPPSLS